MEAAIAECDQFLKPNYTKITRKHTLERITLMRWHIGKTVSPREATYLYYALLTRTQEEALISQINKLSVRSLPPTSVIVTNLAKEILGKEINKNWTGRFVACYKNRLKSKYLRNITNNRVKAEYRPNITEFFKLVNNFFINN
jgi:hypothetical protein